MCQPLSQDTVKCDTVALKVLSIISLSTQQICMPPSGQNCYCYRVAFRVGDHLTTKQTESNTDIL